MCPTEHSAVSSSAPTYGPAQHPPDEVSIAADKRARSLLPPSIYNHSIRVYIYARWLASVENSSIAQPANLKLLFTACVLHDIGCVSQYDVGIHRFEVEGADAAAEHLRRYDVSEADVQDVWTAIACHTSAHIGERITPLARLVRIGVLLDFREENRLAGEVLIDGVSLREAIEKSGTVESAEENFPRLDVNKVLGDAVVEQAMKNEGKAPGASWPGIMLKSKKETPEWDGVNKAF